MCLYTRIVKNPKYLPNKKNNYNPPECEDERLRYIPIKCGNCIECRKQKSGEWRTRLSYEIEKDKTAKFITLTFSEEKLNELINETGEKEANKIATIAVRRFLENWRKHFGKSVKHWLVTELGHNGTERIHIHGIIFTDIPAEIINKIWGRGYITLGYSMNLKTINYTVKYILKIDKDHPEFKPRILCSKGIGSGYENSYDGKSNKYKGEKTDETYTLRNGIKTALPIYYRNKIYNEYEREKLWIQKMEKNEAYVLGQKFKNADSAKTQQEIWEAIKYAREKSKKLGYGDGSIKNKEFLTKNGKKICIGEKK